MGDISIQTASPRPTYERLAPSQPTSESDRRVRELKQRDQEVKAHEQAHLSASGGLATGGARYTYEKGPDGKRYAIGGEVDIRTRSGRTPEETVRNAQQAQKAALAPANPSSQDLQVAASARQTEIEAQAEKASSSKSPDVSQSGWEAKYAKHPRQPGSLIDLIA